MEERLDHSSQLRLRPMARHFSHQSNDSWHISSIQTGEYGPHRSWFYGWRGPLRARIWSRREDLNAPSAEYESAALALSYTGLWLRKTVPFRARVDGHFDHAVRDDPQQATMQLGLQVKRSPFRQGHVKSRS
jgi:hypothetical protein